jgi:hypothetical protein
METYNGPEKYFKYSSPANPRPGLHLWQKLINDGKKLIFYLTNKMDCGIHIQVCWGYAIMKGCSFFEILLPSAKHHALLLKTALFLHYNYTKKKFAKLNLTPSRQY